MLRFRFRLWKRFGSSYCSGSSSGSRSRQYLAQFSNNKNSVQILLFQCQKHYFPESWPLILDFLEYFFYIKFDVVSGSTSASGTGSETGTVMHSGSSSAKSKVTVPAVPVLQHCFDESETSRCCLILLKRGLSSKNFLKIKSHFTLGSDDSYKKTEGTVSTLRLLPFALLISSLGPVTELDVVLLNTGAETGSGELEEVVPLTVGGPLTGSAVCPAKALLGTFANGSAAFKRGREEAEDGEVRTRDPREDREEEDREEEDKEEEDREEEDREEEDREEDDREEKDGDEEEE
jgi:hypothetical protein